MFDLSTLPEAAPKPALQIRNAGRISVEPLILGGTPEAAVELLPRLFNLCRGAQEAAARLALGLDLSPTAEADIRTDILRDHLFKLCLQWPAQLGLPTPAMPTQTAPAIFHALFGTEAAPVSADDWQGFLGSGRGCAPLFQAIATRFSGGLAATGRLAPVTPQNALSLAALENTLAGRHWAHPALQRIAAQHGRGPYWRAVARLIDVVAVAKGDLPRPHRVGHTALVPSARGLYACRGQVDDGLVTAFHRVTPTDHLMAPGGLMDQSLATLGPATDAAPLLLAILDPCHPVTLEPV